MGLRGRIVLDSPLDIIINCDDILARKQAQNLEELSRQVCKPYGNNVSLNLEWDPRNLEKCCVFIEQFPRGVCTISDLEKSEKQNDGICWTDEAWTTREREY
jgi:hypothetical protein